MPFTVPSNEVLVRDVIEMECGPMRVTGVFRGHGRVRLSGGDDEVAWMNHDHPVTVLSSALDRGVDSEGRAR